jgi:hypothetical protein
MPNFIVGILTCGRSLRLLFYEVLYKQLVIAYLGLVLIRINRVDLSFKRVRLAPFKTI